jgi:hypothetical protein
VSSTAISGTPGFPWTLSPVISLSWVTTTLPGPGRGSRQIGHRGTASPPPVGPSILSARVPDQTVTDSRLSASAGTRRGRGRPSSQRNPGPGPSPAAR